MNLLQILNTEEDRLPHTLLRRLLTAWLAAAALEFLALPEAVRTLEGLEGLAGMSGGRMVLAGGALFVMLTVLVKFWGGAGERWALAVVAAVLAGVSLAASFTWPLLAVCLLVLGLFGAYARRGWREDPPLRDNAKTHWAYPAAAAVLALAFFVFVSAWTVGRVRSFCVPTFDFGIFAQMFHSMKTTGLPITTVERDGALSHFAVHVSPIYYLMLPFYCLFPKPETLQVLQAAVLASAVIPLWLLGRRHGLHPAARLLLCTVLLVYPAYSGGTSYDLHENAFLTPLLLWLLYSLDCRRAGLTALFTILTLMVKEDAAVYVAVAALYLLFRALLHKKDRWDLAAGALMLCVSLGWFLAVTGYLANQGDGVMTYRYKNFMYDGSGSLISVIKAVLLCPMKAVYESVDPEKLEFIGLTLLPLAGLPLLTRRYERYLLLIPYILVNLMSDYQYQHDIFFQYTYGATAFLIYLTAVNLADLKVRLLPLGLALAIGLGCFGTQVWPKGIRYPQQAREYSTYYDELRQVLDTVPEGASAAATTFYTTYLSQRDVLYDIRYASTDHVLSCAYIAISPTDTGSFKKYASDGEGGYENFVALLEKAGYVLIDQYEGRLEVYRKQ